MEKRKDIIRDRMVTVRMTPAERVQLESLARAMGRKASDVLRELVAQAARKQQAEAK